MRFSIQCLYTRNVHRIITSFYRASHTKSGSESEVVRLKRIEQKYLRGILSKQSECVLCERPRRIRVGNPLVPGNNETDDSASVPNPLQSIFFKDEMVQQLSSLTQSGLVSNRRANKIEQQCLKRYMDWPFDKQLFVLDLWYFVPKSFRLDIVRRMRDHLAHQIRKLSPGQRAQSLFYIYVWRPNDDTNLKHVEMQFSEDIDAMSLEVMSVWCLALFTNDVKTRNSQLIYAIYDKLIAADLTQLDDIGFNAILKFIGHTSSRHEADIIVKFLPKLLWHVRHSHMIVVSRIAHFVSKLTIFDGELLEAMAERSINQIETMRSKDIERICNTMSIFNYKSNMSTQLLQKISEYLLTVDKDSNAINAIRAIDFMQRCGVSDPRLVAWALDPKTIAQAYSNGKKTNRSELIRIDMYAKIDMANEYSGPKLSSVECNAIFQQKLVENTDGPVQQAQRQILDILTTYGLQYAKTYLLPHFETPDIIVVVNFAIPLDFTSRPDAPTRAQDIVKNQPGVKVIAIVVATVPQYLHGKQTHTGYFELKIQQLRLLGFDVVVIDNRIWQYASTGRREGILREKLAEHLNTNNVKSR